MNLLYLLFDYRHVYLGKTTRSRQRWKIGIAKRVGQRWDQIDKAIRGSSEEPVFWARCLFAGRLEKSLHRKYKRYKVKDEGWGREWFNLPILSRWAVIGYIILYSYVSSAVLICATAYGCLWAAQQIIP